MIEWRCRSVLAIDGEKCGLWYSADEKDWVSFEEREGSAGATADKSEWQFNKWDCGAAVAQGTHNPLVVGSNPSGPKFYSVKSMVSAIDFLFSWVKYFLWLNCGCGF